MLKLKWCVLSLLFFMVLAQAGDLYPFNDPNKQQQFNRLTQELRCLVCQNENLADSNAPLAKDLRNQLYAMVQNNKTDLEIKNYLVNRYGDFILFHPPLDNKTWVLWAAPFILLIVGTVIGISVVRKRGFQ